MTPEQYKSELVRITEKRLDPAGLAVELVKLRLRDGDKPLAKELRLEIERLNLPAPWYHRWPDGVSKWLERHDSIAFFSPIILISVIGITLIVALAVYGGRVQERHQAVKAGVAEWYWTDQGEKRFRLLIQATDDPQSQGISPPVKPIGGGPTHEPTGDQTNADQRGPRGRPRAPSRSRQAARYGPRP